MSEKFYYHFEPRSIAVTAVGGLTTAYGVLVFGLLFKLLEVGG